MRAILALIILLHKQALIFLDAHVEVGVGWLEPLLSHLQHHPQDAAVPILDAIDPNTFSFSKSPLMIGSFGWDLLFQWRMASIKSVLDIQPYSSPVMPGIFALRRKEFDRLEGYDHVW